MSGYSNRGKVMKKTVRVPVLSRGPVLQSCGNLVDNSGNLSRNMGQNGDENWHMTVPVYRLAQEPILPSVSLALYPMGMGAGIKWDNGIYWWHMAYWVANGHFGYIHMVKLHGAHYLISHQPVIQI